MTAAREDLAAVPERGQTVPTLTGPTLEGGQLRTRDFYMRRNLAIVFLGASPEAWVKEASAVRELANAEAGEIILVASEEIDALDLPTLFDRDGQFAARFGLAADDLPAIFVTDRFGTLFAATHGEHGQPELSPADIPGWLEFIACRCS